eukprot:12265938-Ditylum_brightwellii.AAC.1
MASKFQDELHTLCREAKWAEVKALLASWSHGEGAPTYSTDTSMTGLPNDGETLETDQELVVVDDGDDDDKNN